MIYQHPLAYLLGLEAIALLRAFAGEYDRDFTKARLAEVRALLDSREELGDGVAVDAITTTEGYRSWAEFYDEPGNQLVDLEQPVVREILDGLPRGVALDAACGTGRHSAYLAALGHRVIGVDTSAAMLERARERVPEGELHEADLHDLPLPDDHVDLVVCALALVHVPDLASVLAEFVRVLRPGGDLVISDQRGVAGVILPVVKEATDGSLGYMPIRSRLTSDYLAAALPLGLEVRRCEAPAAVPARRRQRCVRGRPRVGSRSRRAREHLGAAPLVHRCDQCGVSRHPRRHRVALPARRSLTP